MDQGGLQKGRRYSGSPAPTPLSLREINLRSQINNSRRLFDRGLHKLDGHTLMTPLDNEDNSPSKNRRIEDILDSLQSLIFFFFRLVLLLDRLQKETSEDDVESIEDLANEAKPGFYPSIRVLYHAVSLPHQKDETRLKPLKKGLEKDLSLFDDDGSDEKIILEILLILGPRDLAHSLNAWFSSVPSLMRQGDTKFANMVAVVLEEKDPGPVQDSDFHCSKTSGAKDRTPGLAADSTVLDIHGLEFGTYRIQDVRDVEDGC
ncbi:MAG: hypothetical protein J3Q66DRAFT_364707 [Benniella sp.]|nr:MAG: hypothetical protein J3Q66DRAFT_364707 [Benniella sp.]